MESLKHPTGSLSAPELESYRPKNGEKRDEPRGSQGAWLDSSQTPGGALRADRGPDSGSEQKFNTDPASWGQYVINTRTISQLYTYKCSLTYDGVKLVFKLKIS